MSSVATARQLIDYVRTELVTMGDPFLREIAPAVNNLAEIQPLCDLMVEKARQLQGAGLAANQIGVPARIVVVELRKNTLFPQRPESPLYIMINPEIISRSEEMVVGWEGCFSVPGMVGSVPRHKSVIVKYLTPDGLTHQETFVDDIARTVQHEIDHLDGILYPERMENMRSFMTRDNFLKFVLMVS